MLQFLGCASSGSGPGPLHLRRQRRDLPVQPDHLGRRRVWRTTAATAAGDEIGRGTAGGTGVAGVLHPTSINTARNPAQSRGT